MSDLTIFYPGITSSNITFPIDAPDGSAAAPSYSFASNAGTGMYASSSGAELDWAINGTKKFSLTASAGVFVGTLAASNLSGTNTGDQTITLTSDVTGSGTGSFATTVAKIQGTTVSGTTGTSNVVFSSAPAISGGSHISLTNFALRDTSAAFDVTLAATSSVTLTTGRTLTIDTKNVSSTLAMGANLTVTGAASISGTQTGTNTGDITLANSTNGLTISGQSLTMALAASSASGTVSATTQTFTGAKTFETQLIGHGTSTNDNAATGYIGEYVESLITNATSVGTSGQFFDLTSITLTAGDWDISATARYAANGASFSSTDLYIGIGTATGNSGTGTVDGVNTAELKGVVPITFLLATIAVPSYRVSISGSTIYYLKGIISSYSVATPTFLCRISARRIR